MSRQRPWFVHEGGRVYLERHKARPHDWSGWQLNCPRCGGCGLFHEEEVSVGADGALTVLRPVECPTTKCEWRGRIKDGEFHSAREEAEVDG